MRTILILLALCTVRPMLAETRQCARAVDRCGAPLIKLMGEPVCTMGMKGCLDSPEAAKVLETMHAECRRRFGKKQGCVTEIDLGLDGSVREVQCGAEAAEVCR